MKLLTARDKKRAPGHAKWALGLAAVAALGLGTAAFFVSKKSSAATSGGATPPPPAGGYTDPPDENYKGWTIAYAVADDASVQADTADSSGSDIAYLAPPAGPGQPNVAAARAGIQAKIDSAIASGRKPG